jgi:hypothetical protein
LWGVAHLIGGVYQVLTLRSGGGEALTDLIASGLPLAPGATTIPGPAAAFMGMGAANIAVMGALVTAVALLNWRNSSTGYWVNLLLVASVDLNLVAFLLAPGFMAWTDGIVGLALFVPAAILSTHARLRSRPPTVNALTAA